jgi:hypothetical protein
MIDRFPSESSDSELLERFKRELMQVCQKYGLRLLGDGDYGISVRTADNKTELADCIWEIGAEGVQLDSSIKGVSDV